MSIKSSDWWFWRASGALSFHSDHTSRLAKENKSHALIYLSSSNTQRFENCKCRSRRRKYFLPQKTWFPCETQEFSRVQGRKGILWLGLRGIMQPSCKGKPWVWCLCFWVYLNFTHCWGTRWFVYILDVLFILLVVTIGYEYNIVNEEQSPERNLCSRHVLLLFSLWTGGSRAVRLQKGVMLLHALICVSVWVWLNFCSCTPLMEFKCP